MTLTRRRGRTTSADGTTIGWLSVGDGPGLVVVHGAMQSAPSQLDLARLLAPTHEVHLVDRRGRGLSGPFAPAGPYGAAEVDDLAAVLAATGARDVLGISSGALIALRAALSLPDLDRVAAFEPPLVLDAPARLAQFDRFRRELAAGNLTDATVTAMLAAEMGPPIMLKLPRIVLRAFTRRMLAAAPKGSSDPDDPTPRELATALTVDLAIVAENADRLADFTAIRATTLLVDGSKTRPYLREAARALHDAIPGSRRVTLPGTNHGVTQNRNQWGRPDRIAPTLLTFFT